MDNMDVIFFDLDGTLVDSSLDITDSVNFTLGEMGLGRKTPEEVIPYIGKGSRDLMRSMLSSDDGDIVEKALDIFKRRFHENSSAKSRIYPMVKETLEHFKRKDKVLITNRHSEIAAKALKELGLYGDFRRIVGGEDDLCRKPSGCPIKKVLVELGAGKNRAIMVGDMDIDILAGKDAGIKTCAVTYGFGRVSDIINAEPDHVINNMSELMSLIV